MELRLSCSFTSYLYEGLIRRIINNAKIYLKMEGLVNDGGKTRCEIVFMASIMLVIYEHCWLLHATLAKAGIACVIFIFCTLVPKNKALKITCKCLQADTQCPGRASIRLLVSCCLSIFPSVSPATRLCIHRFTVSKIPEKLQAQIQPNSTDIHLGSVLWTD